MRNTWTQLVEARNVDERMVNEEAILLNYFVDGESTKLKDRIKEISQAVIDEFWRPEAFEGEEYRKHMMHWKELVDMAIPRQAAIRVEQNYKEGSLLKFTLMTILDQIEFYNNIYTGLFEVGAIMVDGKPGIWCDCEVCNS